MELVRALDQSGLVAALFDPADLLRWANPNYEQRFLQGLRMPVSFSDVLRHGAARGFGVKIDSGDVERFLADILPRRRSAPFRAFATDTLDGRWWWMTETLLPEGWLLSVASDITSLKAHERTLKDARDLAMEVARTDVLTGASNRMHIDELCEAALQLVGTTGGLSVALIDLDHFKRINDLHGHDVGDEVLCAFVACARTQLRCGDAIGRLGGEEFLLVLPGLGAGDAAAMVQRLRLDWPAPIRWPSRSPPAWPRRACSRACARCSSGPTSRSTARSTPAATGPKSATDTRPLISAAEI